MRWLPRGLLLLAFLLLLVGCGMGDEESEGETDAESEEATDNGSVSPVAPTTGDYQVLAFNDLGMHCMDGDYSVFSILPPFNNVHAQVVATGGDGGGTRLVDDATVSVRYRARQDPSGSINSTSAGKTNFWEYKQALFGGGDLAPGTGLTGQSMPGEGAEPFPEFDAQQQWFKANGIPITPIDDSGANNPYPVMTVEAVQNGDVVASTPVVLPVSSEMDCLECHQSDGTAAPDNPVLANDPQIDTRRNILQLHDEQHDTQLRNNQPVKCGECHYQAPLDLQDAGKNSQQQGKPTLSHAVHGSHAEEDRFQEHAGDQTQTCYQCHPGKDTDCLRGAMGGNANIACQDCHGNMNAVADTDRAPWEDLPQCGSCHTGTATDNSGAIRYENAFLPGGQHRQPANHRFAEEANTLFRNSTGHGGLACEACHGSTHAIWPTTESNDALRPESFQGHDGAITECTACHADGAPTSQGTLNGPHGLHPVNSAAFVDGEGDTGDDHGDLYERDSASCQACHGQDLTGTVLSEAATDRTFQTEDGTHSLAAGEQIGCGTCHDNPANGDVDGDDGGTESDDDGETDLDNEDDDDE